MSICNPGRSPVECEGADDVMITARGSPPPIKRLFVSVKSALAITDLGTTKLYELINEGIVQSIKVGKKRLILLASLERLATPCEPTQTTENPTARATAARRSKRTKLAAGREAS
jgi:hypothetical protein